MKITRTVHLQIERSQMMKVLPARAILGMNMRTLMRHGHKIQKYMISVTLRPLDAS